MGEEGSYTRWMGAVRRVGIFAKSVIAVFGCPGAVSVGPGHRVRGTHELGVELGQPGLAVVIEDKHGVDHRGPPAARRALQKIGLLDLVESNVQDKFKDEDRAYRRR